MRILVVDDEDFSRNMLSSCLQDFFGYDVKDVSNAVEALALFKQEPFDIVLADIKMPGMNGIDLLKEIKSLPSAKDSIVILFTGYAEIQTAIQALRLGAYDYLRKPVQIMELKALIKKFEQELAIKKPSIQINTNLDNENPHGENIKKQACAINDRLTVDGAYDIGIYSDKIRNLISAALLYHDEPDIPVLIEGESGTGKEIFARMVHHGLQKSKAPLVSINCSAISRELFESELFGYEGGTFTGSRSTGMKGKLELANGGTLFLDEIGEMPLDLQPKLLRLLQNKTFYRVGGLTKISVNVRIVAATNRNLSELVNSGSFRRDLYHRLNLGWLSLPPLRQQKEAIAPLAKMFLFYFANKRNKKFRIINRDAATLLQNHAWYGNVRELKNAIERIVIHFDDIELKPEHLVILNLENKAEVKSSLPVIKPGAFSLPDTGLNLFDHESEIIEKALEKFNGNKSKAALFLGITRSALRSRLKTAD